MAPLRPNGEGLLERAHDLERLRAISDHARRDAGRLVAVGGEAGVGKSSLIRRFGAELPAGTQLLSSAFDPLTTPAALAPLHEIASSLGLASSDLAGRDRAAVFQSTLDALRAHDPTVWIIEDLHWADGASLDLLRFLTRRIDQTNTLLLVSLRTDEIDPLHPVGVLLGDIASSACFERVDLAPLSVEAVRLLCDDGRAEEIHAVTGGNPFFVTEILANDGDEVPASVQGAVMARVARLTSEVRGLVEAVSIAPRAMAFGAAQQVAAASATAVDDALASGTLIAHDEGVSFRHELARRAVEMSLTVPHRREMHRSMLSLLSDSAEADEYRLAHHAQRCGDAEAIVRYCPPAAAAAARQLAHHETIAYLQSVLAHRRSLEEPVLINVLGSYVAALVGSNLADSAAAADAADELLGLAENSTDRSLVHEALQVVARHRTAVSRVDEAHSLADRVIAIAESLGNPNAVASALVRRAQLSMLARQRAEATRYIERVRAFELLDDDTTAQMLNCSGCIELGLGGDADRGIKLLRESLELGERTNNASAISVALLNLGTGCGEVRKYDDAVGWLTRSIEFSESRDADLYTRYAMGWLARVHFEQGRWDLAETVLGRVERPNGSSMADLTIGGTMGRLGIRRGDADGYRIVSDLLEIGAGADLQYRWTLICAQAEHEWLTGSQQRGREILAPAFEEALLTDSQWAIGELGWWLWRLGGAVDASETMPAPFRAHIEGDWQRAAEEFDSIGNPYEAALARADGPPEAQLHALDRLDHLGARPAATWLRHRLRARGVTRIPRGPRRASREHPAGLTNRQQQVLELTAAGHTNAEIASRLFISAKTVEHHLSAVFGKLGVRTRREATRAFRQFNDLAESQNSG